jgi:hypothetical protein
MMDEGRGEGIEGGRDIVDGFRQFLDDKGYLTVV